MSLMPPSLVFMSFKARVAQIQRGDGRRFLRRDTALGIMHGVADFPFQLLVAKLDGERGRTGCLRKNGKRGRARPRFIGALRRLPRAGCGQRQQYENQRQEKKPFS
jgi:hypothetical protein